MQRVLSGNQKVAAESVDRVQIKGKFFYQGKQKLFIKGVTYGTFAPTVDDYQFPDEKTVEADFRQMAANGINTVRTYTVPPLYLLELALRFQLKVMVGLPWEQHIAFLEKKATKTSIFQRIRQYVQSCQRHPSIFCYTIGNEISASIVRWYGKEKIENYLRQLYKGISNNLIFDKDF